MLVLKVIHLILKYFLISHTDSKKQLQNFLSPKIKLYI